MAFDFEFFIFSLLAVIVRLTLASTPALSSFGVRPQGSPSGLEGEPPAPGDEEGESPFVEKSLKPWGKNLIHRPEGSIAINYPIWGSTAIRNKLPFGFIVGDIQKSLKLRELLKTPVFHFLFLKLKVVLESKKSKNF